MYINVLKSDVEEALRLYTAAYMKHSRRDYKREVRYYTRLFGYKFRSWKSAQKKYASTDYNRFYIVEDSMYGFRLVKNSENFIKRTNTVVEHEITTVVTLDMDSLNRLEKYMPKNICQKIKDKNEITRN